MKKFIYFLLATIFLFTSCDKDSGPNIDTSKAIRDGNFLQAADFKSTSDLKIVHSDKNVIEKIEKGVASFHYSQASTKSTRSDNYIEQFTNISLYEDQLVEFENTEYVLEFSYCYILDPIDGETVEEFENRLKESMKYVNLIFQMKQAYKENGDDYFPGYIIQIGDESVSPLLNNKWQTYRTTIKPMVKELGKYWNINFQLKNTSKVNNNTFFIRNIQLVKK